MNKTLFPLLLVCLAALAGTGCEKKAVLDSDSNLFRDYDALESKLSTVRSHPDGGYNDLLEQFLANYGWNFDLSDIPDGVYETSSVPDRYDFVHYLRLEIRDRRFAQVYYNEFPAATYGSGQDGKRDSELYHKQMVRYGTKSDLRVAYPLMERELIEKQDPLEVDGVSGASLALHRFRILTMKALYEHRNSVLINKKKYELDKDVQIGF